MHRELFEMDRGLRPRFFCGTTSGTALLLERAGGFEPCGLPQLLRYRQRIEVELLPPCAFVAALMKFTVVSTAEWHRELIADFAPERTGLRKLQTVSIRRAAAQARQAEYSRVSNNSGFIQKSGLAFRWTEP